MHHFSRCPSYKYCISHSTAELESPAQVSTIMIEHQLHFFEYFDDKLIYMKNFHLDFVKVLSTQ